VCDNGDAVLLAVWSAVSGQLLMQEPVRLAFRPSKLSFSPADSSKLVVSGPAGIIFFTITQIHEFFNVTGVRGLLDGSEPPAADTPEADLAADVSVHGKDYCDIDADTGLVVPKYAAIKGLSVAQAFVAAAEAAGSILPSAQATLTVPAHGEGAQLTEVSDATTGLPDLSGVASGAFSAKSAAEHAKYVAANCVLAHAWAAGCKTVYVTTAAGTLLAMNPATGALLQSHAGICGASAGGSGTPVGTSLTMSTEHVIVGTSDGRLLFHPLTSIGSPSHSFTVAAGAAELGLSAALLGQYDVPGHVLHRAVTGLLPTPSYDSLVVTLASGVVMSVPLAAVDPEPEVDDDAAPSGRAGAGGRPSHRRDASSMRLDATMAAGAGAAVDRLSRQASDVGSSAPGASTDVPHVTLLDGHCGPVVGVAALAGAAGGVGEGRFATASTDGTVRVWAAENGRQLAKSIFVDSAPVAHLRKMGLLPLASGKGPSGGSRGVTQPPAASVSGGIDEASLLEAGVPRSIVTQLAGWDSITGLPTSEDFGSVLEEDVDAGAVELLRVVEAAESTAGESKETDAAQEADVETVVSPITCIAAHPRLPLLAVGSATGRVRLLGVLQAPSGDTSALGAALTGTATEGTEVGGTAATISAPPALMLVVLASEWAHGGGVSGLAFSADPSAGFLASFSASDRSVALLSISGALQNLEELDDMASMEDDTQEFTGAAVLAAFAALPAGDGQAPTSIAWQYPNSVPVEPAGSLSPEQMANCFPACMAQLIVTLDGGSEVVTLPVPTADYVSGKGEAVLPPNAPAGVTAAGLRFAEAPRALDLTAYAQSIRGEFPATPLALIPTSGLAAGALSGLIEVAYDEEGAPEETDGKDGGDGAGVSLVPMELALAVMPAYASLPLFPLAWEGIVYCGRDKAGNLLAPLVPLGGEEHDSDGENGGHSPGGMGGMGDGVTELVPWEKWGGGHTAGLLCAAVAGGASHGVQVAPGASGGRDVPTLVVATGDVSGMLALQCVAFPASCRQGAAPGTAAGTDEGTQVLATATLTAHSGAITGIAFLSDGRHIVSVGADGTVAVSAVDGSALKAAGITAGALAAATAPAGGAESQLSKQLPRATANAANLQPALLVANTDGRTAHGCGGGSGGKLAAFSPTAAAKMTFSAAHTRGRSGSVMPVSPVRSKPPSPSGRRSTLTGGPLMAQAADVPPAPCAVPLLCDEAPLTGHTEAVALVPRVVAAQFAAMADAVSAAKSSARAALAELKTHLDTLLAANDAAPELEKLDRSEFVVDVLGAERSRSSAAEAAQKRKEQLSVRIEFNAALTQALQRELWESMDTPSTSLVGMAAALAVRNFPLRGLSPEETRALDRVTLLRRLEQAEMASSVDAEPAGKGRYGLLHAPVWRGLLNDLPHDLAWVVLSGLLPASLNPSALRESQPALANLADKLRTQLAASHNSAVGSGNGSAEAGLPLNPQAMTSGSEMQKTATAFWDAVAAAGSGLTVVPSEDGGAVARGGEGKDAEQEEEDAGDGIGATQDWAGVDVAKLLYHPATIRSPAQRRTQILLLGALVRSMQQRFNQHFAALQHEKADEVKRVNKLNARITELAGLLGTAVTLDKPTSSLGETPAHVLTVTQADIGFEPYVSEEERARRAAEEEAVRVAAAANKDAAPQRALADMMDGTLKAKDALEIMAEELGPRPDFMNSDSAEAVGGPDTWTEEQRRAAEAWNSRHAALQEARAQRAKEQDTEMRKLLQDVKDIVAAFDKKLAAALSQRAQVASSSAALELYALKLGLAVGQRDENVVQEAAVIARHSAAEGTKADAAEEAAQFQSALNAAQTALSAARDNDRNLERGIRDALRDASPTAIDRELLAPLLAMYKLRKHDPEPLLPGAEGAAAAAEWAKARGLTSKGGSEMAAAAQASARAGDSRDPHLEVVASLALPDTASILASVEREAEEGVTEEDLPDGLQVGENLHPDVWNTLQQQRGVKVQSELEHARLSRSVSSMNDLFGVLMERYLRHTRFSEALTARFTALLQSRDVAGCDALVLVQLTQGLDESTDDAPYADYSAALLVPRRVVEMENARITTLSDAKCGVLHEQLEFHAELTYMQWTLTYLQALAQDADEYFTDMQLLRVTKELQEFLKGGNPADRQRKDLVKLEARGKHSAAAHVRNLAKLRRTLARVSAQVHDKKAENDQLAAHHAELLAAVTVREGILQSKTGGMGSTTRKAEARQARKFKTVASRRALAERARKQAAELAELRSEVDRLRRKTFPSFDAPQVLLGGVDRR